jgi:hypothetical protein
MFTGEGIAGWATGAAAGAAAAGALAGRWPASDVFLGDAAAAAGALDGWRHRCPLSVDLLARRHRDDAAAAVRAGRP